MATDRKNSSFDTALSKCCAVLVAFLAGTILIFLATITTMYDGALAYLLPLGVILFVGWLPCLCELRGQGARGPDTPRSPRSGLRGLK